jgi:hypothetical protein
MFVVCFDYYVRHVLYAIKDLRKLAHRVKGDLPGCAHQNSLPRLVAGGVRPTISDAILVEVEHVVDDDAEELEGWAKQREVVIRESGLELFKVQGKDVGIG